MTITLETKPLLRALEIAALATQRRNTVPVLDGLRCRTRGDGTGGDLLEVTGTDMDCWLQATAPIKPNGAAPNFDEVLLGTKAIRRALRQIGGDEVTLDAAGSDASIRSGRLSLDVAPLPAEDFPTLPLLAHDEGFTATLGEDFIRAIERVRPAISTEETRYYLNGIYLHAGEGPWAFTAVATDGHRMHIADIALPDAQGTLDGIIIPRAAIALLLSLASRAGGEPIRMRVARTLERNSNSAEEVLTASGGVRAEFAVGESRLVTRLIDGAFPDYSRVVPQDLPRGATFERAALVRAVEALSSWRDGGRAPCLRFDFTDDEVKLSAKWEYGSGRITTDLPFEGDAGLPTFGANGGYLSAALDALGHCERVTIAMAPASNHESGAETSPSFPVGQYEQPMVLASPEDERLKVVLMPMRV